MPALDGNLESALNHHVTEELAASHRYLASSAALRELGLNGMASWMLAQSEEERAHAMKFLEHVLARHGHVKLEQIPAPPAGKQDARLIFRAALALEEATTKRIETLHGKADKAGDVALRVFLEWFLQEQVQEEDQLRSILDRFELAGDDKGARLIIDQELAGRSRAPKRSD
ncbi:MAG TPA: ferritin [Candidatus Thermoplasmatota archaeon]|nr:ferritin [Candidatus Thermoplasmatota archaeon]